MKRTLVLMVSLFVALHAHAESAFDKAIELYGCGDYPKALKAFIPLAEEGDRYAQFQVGMMLEQGQGAEANLKKAYDWYLRAAKQGVADAYFALGQIYALGNLKPADPIQAYAWFDLAVKGGNKVALDWRNKVAPDLKPDDFVIAHEKATTWLKQVTSQ